MNETVKEKKQYHIYGIGNAIIDISAEVDDIFIEKIGSVKGSMNLIDSQQQQNILKKIECEKLQITVGGSCANTIYGLAGLGTKTAFTAKIGKDTYGKLFTQSLEEAKITTQLSPVNEKTHTSVILITSDGQRTMNTCLSPHMNLIERDIAQEILDRSAMLYLEIYLWDEPNQTAVLQKIISVMKQKKRDIAFNLGDKLCVERNKQSLLKIMKGGITQLFGNEEEYQMLTGKNEIHEIIDFMRQYLSIFVITQGEKGAVIFNKGQVSFMPAFKVNAVDTTGAGDMFTAAFLYGFFQNYSLLHCAMLGNYFASLIVQQRGARPLFNMQKELGIFQQKYNTHNS